MLLEFGNRWRLFYVKMQNYKKWVTHPFRPRYFVPCPKILLPIFSIPRSEVLRKVCNNSVVQKLREEMDFLEKGFFYPEG
jgi:hypothetical protein